jgi:hypothetical protein
MLRAVRDRELAKEAARVNVSALLFGQPRIMPLEGRVNGRQLENALGRGGEDLAAIRRAVSACFRRRCRGCRSDTSDTWGPRDERRSLHGRPQNV